MLKTKLIHPEILSALGRGGHLSTVLVTDGNYPHSNRVHPAAPIVWANYRPGLLDGVTVLEMLCDVIPIEAVTVMEPARSGMYAMETDPPIWESYRSVLAERAGFTNDFQALQKPAFNEIAQSNDLCLVIATGEQAIYANYILTVGVVK